MGRKAKLALKSSFFCFVFIPTFLHLTQALDTYVTSCHIIDLFLECLLVATLWFIVWLAFVLLQIWKIPLFIFKELKLVLEPFDPREVTLRVEKPRGKRKLKDDTARDDEMSEAKGYENTAVMDEEDEE